MRKRRFTSIIFNNKKNLFKYHIIDSYEFGIVLTGLEVKSLRILNDVQLKNPHIFFYNNMALVVGIFIRLCPFSINSASKVVSQQRERQLLLKRKEFLYLKNLQTKNGTLLIDTIYWKESFVKIRVVVAKYIQNFSKNSKKRLMHDFTTT